MVLKYILKCTYSLLHVAYPEYILFFLFVWSRHLWLISQLFLVPGCAHNTCPSWDLAHWSKHGFHIWPIKMMPVVRMPILWLLLCTISYDQAKPSSYVQCFVQMFFFKLIWWFLRGLCFRRIKIFLDLNDPLPYFLKILIYC